MTKTVCFANNKGGSGKSTTCANVGYFLAKAGKRVLLVDGDMQCNLSLSFFPEDRVLEIAKSDQNLYTAVRAQTSAKPYILKTDYENLSLLPSSTLMSGIEVELFSKWQREFVLKKCLSEVRESGEYDYILIDAPPTLGGWVMNILVASDFLVIPVEASPWGLFGLANLLEFVNDVKTVSPALSLLGVAVTKVDARKNYFRQTMETLGEFGKEVRIFENYIRLDSNVEWSQDNCKPVGAYKKSARSAGEYEKLAEEIDRYAGR